MNSIKFIIFEKLKKMAKKQNFKIARIVKKSNVLINSTLKNYNLIQLKIINNIICSMSENTTQNDVFSFRASEILEITGRGSENHQDLCKAIEGMFHAIQLYDEENKKTTMFSSLHKAVYHEGGLLEFQLHELIIPYLIRAKNNYTRYYFENIQRLKSKYSLKLYELCKQYQNTQQKYREIKVSDLRVFFDIPDEKYKRFSDVNKHVIQRSISEINDKTDIYVQTEAVKNGRSVISVRFHISKNENFNSDLTAEEREIRASEAILSEIGVNQTAIQSILADYPDEDFLLFLINKAKSLIQTLKAKGGEIQNLGPYFVKVLSNLDTEEFRKDFSLLRKKEKALSEQRKTALQESKDEELKKNYKSLKEKNLQENLTLENVILWQILADQKANELAGQGRFSEVEKLLETAGVQCSVRDLSASQMLNILNKEPEKAFELKQTTPQHKIAFLQLQMFLKDWFVECYFKNFDDWKAEQEV